MTEIPAKTPRPIGRTANFLPGIADSAAAEIPETPTGVSVGGIVLDVGISSEVGVVRVSGGGIVLVVGIVSVLVVGILSVVV